MKPSYSTFSLRDFDHGLASQTALLSFGTSRLVFGGFNNANSRNSSLASRTRQHLKTQRMLNRALRRGSIPKTSDCGDYPPLILFGHRLSVLKEVPNVRLQVRYRQVPREAQVCSIRVIQGNFQGYPWSSSSPHFSRPRFISGPDPQSSNHPGSSEQ